jgi:hypothetical protein
MIYYIHERATGAVKIGYTGGNPRARLSALQTGHPSELTLLYHHEGGHETERQLHAQFADNRLAGEWFRMTPELIEHLIAMAHDEGYETGRREQEHYQEGVLDDARTAHLEWLNANPPAGLLAAI